MSGFDWIIAAIFLVSILVGIMRGFIKESLSIISWIVAIWLAFTFCAHAGDFLNQYINIPNLKFRWFLICVYRYLICICDHQLCHYKGICTWPDKRHGSSARHWFWRRACRRHCGCHFNRRARYWSGEQWLVAELTAFAKVFAVGELRGSIVS